MNLPAPPPVKLHHGKGVSLPAGMQLGQYRLLHKIGQGGFGITYLAEHLPSKEQVVIKENLPTIYAYRHQKTMQVLPLGSESAIQNYSHTLKRFVDEALTLAHLKHPNIVSVREAFEALGTAYYVMPYIPGSVLHQAAPPEVDEAWLLPILKTLLGALEYLHGQNLLHRDLKPSNILLSDDGAPTLIDFGSARALHTARTCTMLGTHGYIPPEQMIPHGKCGAWSDLYALGATCYRLITGEIPPPCVVRLEDDTVYRPLQTRDELLSRFSPTILQSIDTALAIQGKNRWQTACAWLDELEKIARPRPPKTDFPPPVTTEPAPETSTHNEADSFPHEESTTCISTDYTETLSTRPNGTRKSFIPFATKWFIIFPAILLLIFTGASLYVHSYLSTITQANMSELGGTLFSPEEIKLNAQRKLNALKIYNFDKAICSKNQNSSVLKLLIQAGANVNTTNAEGYTALHLALLRGDTENVKLLLASRDIDVNQVDANGQTPLVIAIKKRQEEHVRLLLTAPGIDVNKTDTRGYTPLRWAAYMNHTQSVTLLLRKDGIMINKGDLEGYTPLFWAHYVGATECAQLLIAAGGKDIRTRK